MKTLVKIIIASGIALVVQLAIRQYLGAETLINELSTITTYLGVFGTIYAIIVGFVIFIALNRFSGLSSAVSEESSELGDVIDLVSFVANQSKVAELITEKLRDYVSVIVNDEWKTLERGTYSEKANLALDSLIKSIDRIKPEDASDGVALEALINKVTSLTTWRDRRISLASQPLPPMLQRTLMVLSVSLIGGFLLLVVSNFWIQAFISVSIVTAVVLLSELINDLDHPFVGIWNISKEPYERLLKGRF